MDFSEQQRRLRERVENQQFQLNMQNNNQLFQKQLTDKFISEYRKTNQELQTINSNLQKQLDDTKRSAKTANIKSWISIAVSVCSVITAIVVGFCT